ncbi:hypothetical protein SAMN04488591_1351 [Microbacterium azadirachtae]|uniref:Uncharacterized protein n=1 Tax=Microbacterium azadirachtae TaxID=582680 RepID=A0A1I6GLV3_9MICO|nr:hypothetical protein [Microbacterium azadirachtae]SFR43193.1 hypothetical protein SAMN04488591_1351 [Microbacterium azadirachtae]
MTVEDDAADAALLARLRAMWETQDQVPAGLADRMVAAVAVEDLGREYALLTLVEQEGLAAVRGEADTATLQFSDGRTGIVLHISASDAGLRRVDGWVDGEALAIRLAQGDREWGAEVAAPGRFAFEGIPAGLSALRLVLRGPDGEPTEFRTPRFEV